MKFEIFNLITVIVVSVSGQFYETEFSIGSVPLDLRRIITYQVQPTEAREIRPDEISGSISQGRRHIDNRRNIDIGQNQNVNNFEISPENNIRNKNRQNSNRENVNQNKYRNQIDNTQRNTQNRVALVQDPNSQQYITLNNDGKADQTIPNEQKYSEERRENQQQTNNRPVTESTNLNRNSHIASNIKTSTTRAIITGNTQNNFNGNTKSKSGVYNNPNERRQNTSPTDRIGNRPSEDSAGFQIVANDGAGKTGQDNELLDKPRADDKWVWNESSEMKIKTTTEPIVPTIDDRASFLVEKCPENQVRFNGVCVDRD